MHVEAVREQQAGARHVRLDHFAVQLRLHHVGGQHGDDLRRLHRFGRRLHREAVGLGLEFGGAAGAQADGDIETGVAQVERMRAALAAVADDGDAGVCWGLRWFVAFWFMASNSLEGLQKGAGMERGQINLSAAVPPAASARR
jgi:hypothetical protein